MFPTAKRKQLRFADAVLGSTVVLVGYARPSLNACHTSDNCIIYGVNQMDSGGKWSGNVVRPMQKSDKTEPILQALFPGCGRVKRKAPCGCGYEAVETMHGAEHPGFAGTALCELRTR